MDDDVLRSEYDEAIELLKLLIGIHRTTAETDFDMLEQTIHRAEVLTGYEYVEEDEEWCYDCDKPESECICDPWLSEEAGSVAGMQREAREEDLERERREREGEVTAL